MDYEMIEKVAIAIRLRDTNDEFAMSRAAIEAMREPTEAILKVGVDRNMADGYWRLMIDAVIND